jgi:serine/threonine-protein kinase
MTEHPVVIGERRVQFARTVNDVVDLSAGRDNVRVRVTMMPGPLGNRMIHLKGLTCFVAPVGGRPSPAVMIEQPGDIALVTPRAQDIGHIRVATGMTDGPVTVFPLGSEYIGIALEDCTDAILFDFGPGSDAYFVYTSGRPIPKTRR